MSSEVDASHPTMLRRNVHTHGSNSSYDEEKADPEVNGKSAVEVGAEEDTEVVIEKAEEVAVQVLKYLLSQNDKC